MRLFIQVSLSAVLFASVPVFAQIGPQENIVKESQAGRVKHTGSVRASVAITAIDKASRKLTVKNAAGQLSEIVAGSEVRNFDQIHVGDEVTVEYVRSLSLQLKKAGSTSEPSASQVLEEAPLGAKPSGSAATHVTVIADVIDVNPGNKTITLMGKTGNITELNVTNPDQFKVVQVGDHVEVTYSEAVAIAVTSAKK
jgi:hypothetical protein